MPVNVKKSACMRVVGRFNAKYANAVKEVNYRGLITYDILRFILSQLHPLNVRMTLLNVSSSIAHVGKYLTLDHRKLLTCV